jgi:DNA-binding transcriptional LysR family regulator
MFPVPALVRKIEIVKPSFAMLNDLNDIRIFALIVEKGSLTAASEALGVTKSMLSQHLASLEKELGVQLIRRTSRRLEVTDVGKRYYGQCAVILNEIVRASSITDSVRTLPRGKLRISCPINFAHATLAPVLASFMLQYPDVEVELGVTNRAAVLTAEGYDFVLHIGPDVRSSTLVRSSFSMDSEMLVASPALLSRLGTPRTPAEMKSLPSAAGHQPPDSGGRYLWHLSGKDGVRHTVQHHPRLLTEDLWVIRESALAGCAVVSLPLVLCRDAIDMGRLVQVLPGWTLREQKLHVMYPSRQGLTLAARTLIDFISNHLRSQLRNLQDGTLQMQMLAKTGRPKDR